MPCGSSGARRAPGECYLAVALGQGIPVPDRRGFAGRRHGHRGCGASSPERVFTARLDGGHYLWPFQARNLLEGWGLSPARRGNWPSGAEAGGPCRRKGYDPA